MEFVGDIRILPAANGTYEVTRDGEGVIGVTTSEQEAMALACSQRRGGRVSLVERETGAAVPVDCPVESPLQNLGKI